MGVAGVLNKFTKSYQKINFWSFFMDSSNHFTSGWVEQGLQKYL